MNQTPKISVIVAAYNAEKYIRRCLDSILAQTMPDFEVIVVNDGSTDGTPAILEEYASQGMRRGESTAFISILMTGLIRRC